MSASTCDGGAAGLAGRAYLSDGTKLKGKGKQIVPPDARIFYDVELIAINALSTE